MSKVGKQKHSESIGAKTIQNDYCVPYESSDVGYAFCNGLDIYPTIKMCSNVKFLLEIIEIFFEQQLKKDFPSNNAFFAYNDKQSGKGNENSSF